MGASLVSFCGLHLACPPPHNPYRYDQRFYLSRGWLLHPSTLYKPSLFYRFFSCPLLFNQSISVWGWVCYLGKQQVFDYWGGGFSVVLGCHNYRRLYRLAVVYQKYRTTYKNVLLCSRLNRCYSFTVSSLGAVWRGGGHPYFTPLSIHADYSVVSILNCNHVACV